MTVAERKNKWPMRVAVCLLMVWGVGVFALSRWGPDDIKCYLAVALSWNLEKTERICLRAYPDTWRKKETS